MNQQNPARRCNRTSLILSACFLAAVFFLFFATIFTRGGSLLNSLKYNSAHSYLTTDDPGLLEMTSARIASLDNAMSENLYLSDELGYLCASIQYGMGKKMVNIGNASMLKTDEGYLYDITDEYDFSQSVGEVVAFREALGRDMPFLYIHEHALGMGDTDADELPAGYVDLDFSYENSDAIVDMLENADIPVLDSRAVFGSSGYNMDALMMRTDHHWTTLGNIIMAQATAEQLKSISGLPIDTSLLDLEKFAAENYPAILLGQRGQRVGEQNTMLDDVALYYPTYDTHLTRISQKNQYSEQEQFEGSFREAIIRWDAMERDRDGYNTSANGAYGFTEAFNHYHNENAPQGTLLVLKDSYSGQISSFLSLLFQDVVVVDLRKVDQDGMYFVEQYRPDAVMVGFCQQMLMDHKYTLYDAYWNE